MSAALDHWKRLNAGEIERYAERIEDHIKWLEGDIRQIRRDIENGNTVAARNCVAKAADILEYAEKYNAARGVLDMFRMLDSEDGDK
jgi:hypothetical protein